MIIDAKHVCTDLFLNLEDGEIDTIVARAGEIAVKKDGSGIEALPRPSQESLLREAFRELETEKEFAKRPPLFTEAEIVERETKRDMAELAFGSKPSLKARGAYISAYGLEIYHAELAAWGGSPGNLKAGSPPRARRASPEREITADKKKTAKDNGGSNDGDTSKSENPWADNYKGTPEQAFERRLQIIRSGTQRASSLAKSARKTIDNRPLFKTVNG
jgi:hypothetical protein